MFSFLKNNKKDVKDYLKDLRGTQSIPATIGEKLPPRMGFSPYSQREEDVGSLVPKGSIESMSTSSHGYPKPDVQSQQQQSQSQSHYQPPTQPPPPPPTSAASNPLQASRASMVNPPEQPFQTPNYHQQMMFNPMMNPLRASQMFLPVQADMQGGMPMMYPYGYAPYMQQMPMMPQQSFQSHMLKVSEAKEDEDDEAEASATRKKPMKLPEKPQVKRQGGRFKSKRSPASNHRSVSSPKSNKEQKKNSNPPATKSFTQQLPTVNERRKTYRRFQARSKKRLASESKDSIDQKPAIEHVFMKESPEKGEKRDISSDFRTVVGPLSKAISLLDSRRKNNKTYRCTVKALEDLDIRAKRTAFLQDSATAAKSLLGNVGQISELRDSHTKLMRMLENLHEKVVTYAIP